MQPALSTTGRWHHLLAVFVAVAACGGKGGLRLTSDGSHGGGGMPSGGAGGERTSGQGGSGGGAGGSSGSSGSGGVSGGTGFADAGPTPSDGNATRVPKNHRPAGVSCPQQRGPGTWTNWCQLDGGLAPGETGCMHDSDCTAGTDGRCLTSGGPLPPGCTGGCSYDGCFSDADCPGHVPCDCRASDLDSNPNWCVAGSNCRLDGDCEFGSYCSPSLFGWCMRVDGNGLGSGYFCHTQDDTCTDDADCSGGGNCGYDPSKNLWSCFLCVMPP